MSGLTAGGSVWCQGQVGTSPGHINLQVLAATGNASVTDANFTNTSVVAGQIIFFL
jgi:hypothetical protein